MRSLLLVLLLTVGCASVPEWQVRVDTPTAYGQGCQIDSQTVVTLNHIVPDTNVPVEIHKRGLFRRAHVLYTVDAGGTEPLVVLRLERPLPLEENPEIQKIRPGDSGSLCLGQDGQVIGLVSGYWTIPFDHEKFRFGGKPRRLILVTPLDGLND